MVGLLRPMEGNAPIWVWRIALPGRWSLLFFESLTVHVAILLRYERGNPPGLLGLQSAVATFQEAFHAR